MKAQMGAPNNTDETFWGKVRATKIEEGPMPLDVQAQTEIKAIVEAATAPLLQIVQGLTEMPTRLIALESLVQNFQAAQVPAEPSHPYGLCNDNGCSSCVSASQQIAQKAYQQGRDDGALQTEELLGLAGGEPLKKEVKAKITQGLAIWRNRQPLTVTTP